MEKDDSFEATVRTIVSLTLALMGAMLTLAQCAMEGDLPPRDPEVWRVPVDPATSPSTPGLDSAPAAPPPSGR